MLRVFFVFFLRLKDLYNTHLYVDIVIARSSDHPDYPLAPGCDSTTRIS
jgi:hypothetical protein